MDPSAPPPSYDEAMLGFNPAYSSKYEPIRFQALRSRNNLQITQIQQPCTQQEREFTHENVPIQALNQVYSRSPEHVISQYLNRNSLGRKSESYQCPHCGHNIQTKISAVINKTTHVPAIILCLLGCFLCCWIPYCVNTCKDIEHFCPDCNSFLGVNDVDDFLML